MRKRLLALIVCLVVAALLVVRAKNPAPFPLDEVVLRFLHRVEARGLTLLFNVTSWLGSIVLIGPLAIFVAYRIVRLSRRDAWAVLLTAFGATLVHTAIKMSLPRARPELFPALGLQPGEGTFPSGHAVNVTATFLALAWIARRHGRTVYLPALTIIACVSLGRLYLQVHWPSDVVAGIVIGACWAIVVDLVLDATFR